MKQAHQFEPLFIQNAAAPIRFGKCTTQQPPPAPMPVLDQPRFEKPKRLPLQPSQFKRVKEDEPPRIIQPKNKLEAMMQVLKKGLLKSMLSEVKTYSQLQAYLHDSGNKLGQVQTGRSDTGVSCGDVLKAVAKKSKEDLVENKDLSLEMKLECFRTRLTSLLQQLSGCVEFDDQNALESLSRLMGGEEAEKQGLGAISNQTEFEELTEEEEGKEDLELAGKLEWVLEVDSIFNYKARIPKIRRQLIGDDAPCIRRTWHADSILSTYGRRPKPSNKPRHIPRYFLGKEANEQDKKLFLQLKEWETEVRDTLRVYPMNIENPKHNIASRLRSEEVPSQGKKGITSQFQTD